MSRRIVIFVVMSLAGLMVSFLVVGAGMLLFHVVGNKQSPFRETEEPPLAQQLPTGPFRPRPPKPVPPPDPQPENDVERRLFPRIQALLDAHSARVEARAEAKVEEALNDVATKMSAVAEGADPELMQGFFGGAFVSAILAFVKKAVVFAIKAVLITIIGGMIVQYWFIVGPVLLFFCVILPAWSARTFVKAPAPPKP